MPFTIQQTSRELMDKIKELGCVFSNFTADRLFIYKDRLYEYIGDVNYTNRFRSVTSVFNASYVTDDALIRRLMSASKEVRERLK